MTLQSEMLDCPTAWFAVLERARKTGDYDLADRAAGELRRLGVEVVFGNPEVNELEPAQ